MNVTFIGLGIMGSRMASRLINDDVRLTVFNRDPEKANELVTKGASLASNIPDAVDGADVIITMLSNPTVVCEVFDQIRGNASPGSIWIDSSTVGPYDVKRFAEKANEAGITYLEAPVAGTKQPAEKGELVFFVGGEADDLKKVETLLGLMGKKTIHMGQHGQAAAIKLLVNLLLGQTMLVYSEAIQLGTAMGLPAKKTQQILLNTPVTAPFLEKVHPKIESQDTTPNFPLELMHKDLKLVQQACANTGISLSSASVAEVLYGQANASGKGREDFSSIFHFLFKA